MAGKESPSRCDHARFLKAYTSPTWSQEMLDYSRGAVSHQQGLMWFPLAASDAANVEEVTKRCTSLSVTTKMQGSSH